MQRSDTGLVFAATDLANHLPCRHLTQLSRKVADGEMKRPYRDDPVLKTLIERGIEHEREFVEHLKSEGKSVVDLTVGSERAQRTLDAMRRGYDVIVQAELRDGQWMGYADLLLKVERSSDLGDWSYEVADTKLTLTTRAGTVLQLCLYSDLLGTLQGTIPERMAVVKPGEPFRIEYFRVDDFLAYFNLVKHGLEDAASASRDTYPDPVPHCEVCQWWSACNQQRRDDDHLTFVAGIQKHQTIELTEQGLGSLELFATSDTPLRQPPIRGSVDSFDRVHRQVKIQHESRTKKTLIWEHLEPEDERGLFKLPEPDAGDVFFDIEGARHAPDGGLEYLLGFVLPNEKGDSEYKVIWAMTRLQEKIAFEEFIDFLMAQWETHPGMHVYHYAHYEPTAMKKLAMRHATREDEVDRLLRAERFIDLYTVVRQSVIAGVESYSIKKLEPFYGYERKAELADARHALQRFERAMDLGLDGDILDSDRGVVLAYNEDDCVSTLNLRNWLEEIRQRQIESGNDIPRPELLDGTASEPMQQRNDEVSRVFNRLVAGLPETDRTSNENARWLMAHLLEYFRREDKCVWWEYFRMHELEPDELLAERKGLAGLEFVGEVPGKPGVRLPTHRYRFPFQEASFDFGSSLEEVTGGAIGSVAHFDPGQRTIDIKKRGDSIDIHPSEIFAFDRIAPHPMPESILLFADAVAASSVDVPPRNARYALLAKEPPRFHSKALPMSGPLTETAILLAADLDNSVLPIQGPPGAGKTFLGSRMIAELARQGKRIGVTAVSHKVITNLLKAVSDYAGDSVRLAQKLSSPDDEHPPSINILKAGSAALGALDDGCVTGGTAWLWSNDVMKDHLDYLFIDEAGQMSLAMAVAAGQAAKNIVLLGDPQQLEQPQQGSHPEGAEVAALNHLLDGHQTIPEDRGIFIPSTWRLHPTICDFTSEQYYERRLSSRDGLDCQIVVGDSGVPQCGLVFVPVPHDGNQNQSPEEAEAIRHIFELLLNGSHSWCNQDNEEISLTSRDILVVAPYNAQVALLQNSLPHGARVGTVDKFQGQEAAIVIYSMTSSSVADAPRGMEFLYSPNRMNVATSRARCLDLLIGTPALFNPECTTPQQMKLANGFCRYLEMAQVWEIPA